MRFRVIVGGPATIIRNLERQFIDVAIYRQYLTNAFHRGTRGLLGRRKISCEPLSLFVLPRSSGELRSSKRPIEDAEFAAQPLGTLRRRSSLAQFSRMRGDGTEAEVQDVQKEVRPCCKEDVAKILHGPPCGSDFRTRPLLISPKGAESFLGRKGVNPSRSSLLSMPCVVARRVLRSGRSYPRPRII